MIEHPSEFWALSAVQAGLESTLAEPFAKDFLELVAEAREKLIAESDPEGTYGPIGGDA